MKKYHKIQNLLFIILVGISSLSLANINTEPVEFRKINGKTKIYTCAGITNYVKNAISRDLTNCDVVLHGKDITLAENINEKAGVIGTSNTLEYNGSMIIGDSNTIVTNNSKNVTYDKSRHPVKPIVDTAWGNFIFGTYNTNYVGDTTFLIGKFLNNYNSKNNVMFGQYGLIENSYANILIGVQNSNKGHNKISSSSTETPSYENILITTRDSYVLDSHISNIIGQKNTITNGNCCTILGYGSYIGGITTNNQFNSWNISIGSKNTITTGSYNTALGYSAHIKNASNAIQIGLGTNTESNTAKIKGCVVVNAQDKIPTASLDRAAEIEEALEIIAKAKENLVKLETTASNDQIIDKINEIIEILNPDQLGVRAPE